MEDAPSRPSAAGQNAAQMRMNVLDRRSDLRKSLQTINGSLDPSGLPIVEEIEDALSLGVPANLCHGFGEQRACA